MRTNILILTVAAAALKLVLAAPADIGSAYTGPGGGAPGGSVNSPDPGTECQACEGWDYDLLDVFSNNAGSGGDAASGDAHGGNTASSSKNTDDAASAGNAYTGPGGQAPGGSVNNPKGGLINLWSGNAGDGGNAKSGDSEGGNQL